MDGRSSLPNYWVIVTPDFFDVKKDPDALSVDKKEMFGKAIVQGIGKA